MQFLSSIALALTLFQALTAGLTGMAAARLAAPVETLTLPETEPVWRVEIPRVGLSAPVELAERTLVDGKRTWTVPCYNAASLMTRGTNTTLFGHRDTCDGVFDDLGIVELGDVVSFDERTYVVQERHVVTPEEIWPVNDHGDERLTMISCWPPGSIEFRLVVVAIHQESVVEVLQPEEPEIAEPELEKSMTEAATRPAPSRISRQAASADIGILVPTTANAVRSTLWKATSMPLAIISGSMLVSSLRSH